jgi:homoserine kinase
MCAAPPADLATARSIMQEVTVRVPASTSNLGPGFDCLGVALRLHNDVTVRRGRATELRPMMREAADLFFARAKRDAFHFSCTITGDVPASRGLGSSVTVRTGVMHALNELAERPLNREELFALCVQLEGHPDNAAPASFGGFNVARSNSHQRFAVAASLKFVLLVPPFEIRTADARALLPAKLRRTDAVESCGNACAITAAFASQNYAALRGAFTDKLHEPFRKPLLPFFDEVVSAAENAGALGTFLSGSGSTIAAVTMTNAREVAEAIAAAAPKTARVIITSADNRGARILPTR